MRKENSDFKTSFISEVGSFIQNKDYFAYTELDDYACWVVAKGFDHDQQVNSAELVVKGVLEKFIEKPSLSKGSIKKYLINAQKILQEQSIRVRLKASVVVVVTDYTNMIVGLAGNARLYQFRNGRVAFKTQDQSLSQQLMNQTNNYIDISEHEERNNLLNYVGIPNKFEPFISNKMKLQDGDVLLLCTPGVWEEVNETEMVDALENVKDPVQYTELLEEVLLSRQRKVVNNYTMVSIFVDKVYQQVKKDKKKYVKIIVAALIACILVGGMTAFYKVREAKKIAERTEEMMEHASAGDLYFEDENYEGAIKEYSEARNAAKAIKSTVHKNLYAKKLRISQLIADGDQKVEEGKFDEAVAQYEKAKEEGKLINKFGEEMIDKRLESMDEVIEIVKYIENGDQKFAAEDYNGALAMYDRARKKAITVSFSGKEDLNNKIEEAEAKVEELLREQKHLKAEGLEKSGDDSYARQDYKKAIESYTLAQEIYQETGLLSKVLGLERKIMNANDKLNPPISDTPATPLASDKEPNIQEDALMEGK